MFKINTVFAFNLFFECIKLSVLPTGNTLNNLTTIISSTANIHIRMQVYFKTMKYKKKWYNILFNCYTES